MINMNKWKNVAMESSSGLTKQFAQFARDYKKAIKESATDFELATYYRGHFYISGFLKHKETGKLIYFSTSEIRNSNCWLDRILVRTAKDLQDYSGGANNFTALDSLNSTASKLVK